MYVLVLLFMTASGYQSVTTVGAPYASKESCERSGEAWKEEAKKNGVLKGQYICLTR